MIDCLCITENRPEWMPWVVWQFDRQTIQQKRLIIVDSSRFPMAPIPGRDDIIIIKAPGRNIPEKRNIAITAATSPLAAWWDDDDHHPRHHLEIMAIKITGDALITKDLWFINTLNMLCSNNPSVPAINSMVFNPRRVPRFDQTITIASDRHWLGHFTPQATGLSTVALLCHSKNVSNPAGRRPAHTPVADIADKIDWLINPPFKPWRMT